MRQCVCSFIDCNQGVAEVEDGNNLDTQGYRKWALALVPIVKCLLD